MKWTKEVMKYEMVVQLRKTTGYLTAYQQVFNVNINHISNKSNGSSAILASYIILYFSKSICRFLV